MPDSHFRYLEETGSFQGSAAKHEICKGNYVAPRICKLVRSYVCYFFEVMISIILSQL